MIDGVSAAELYGMASQAEKAYEKGTSDGKLKFRDVYENTAESMDVIFEEAASTYGVSVDLLKAVAKAESNFNPSAVSHAGAIGVMQLMPATASSLGVADPFDARQNIMGGAKYLKSNLEKYGGDVSLALAAYNAGPGSVAKYGGIPPYAETQNYVKKVTSYMSGSPLYAGTFVNSRKETPGSSYSSSLDSILGASSSTDSLGSLLGTSSSVDSFGSLLGSPATTGSQYGFHSSGNLYGTSELAGFGSGYGSSALTGMGSLYGMSSVYGSSTNLLSLLLGASVQDREDDELQDKDNLYNLVELVKLQLMMNAGGQVGTMSV